jgi:hypothetical protein
MKTKIDKLPTRGLLCLDTLRSAKRKRIKYSNGTCVLYDKLPSKKKKEIFGTRKNRKDILGGGSVAHLIAANLRTGYKKK